MAFREKIDYCGLSKNTNGALKVLSTEESKATQEATAMGENGDIVATEVFGETESPTCEYAVAQEWTGNIVLGSINEVLGDDGNNHYYCLTEVSLGSSAGGYPTLSAKCEGVPDNRKSCTYTIQNVKLLPKCHSQILLDGFTYSGEGVHLTECTATISANFNDSTKDGNRLAWDVTEGQITMSCTFVSTKGNKPVVNLKDDTWIMSSPLTCSNPDSDFPTYSCEVHHYLTKDVQTEGTQG